VRVAIGSDEKTRVTEVVTEYLQNKGIEVEPHGPLTGEPLELLLWASGRENVARVQVS